MSDYEKKLVEGLNADESTFLRNLEDNRGLFTQYAATFDGPMKLFTWIAFILTLVVSGVALWATYRFVTGAEVREMLLWGGAAWAAWTVQIALKQWQWARINQLAVLRELKKIELRIARIETDKAETRA